MGSGAMGTAEGEDATWKLVGEMETDTLSCGAAMASFCHFPLRAVAS